MHLPVIVVSIQLQLPQAPSILQVTSNLNPTLKMHLSAVVLGFAAAVAAIDLRLYDNGNCGGGYLGFTNVGPGVCYAYDRDTHSSAEWRAIPWDWSINVGIYKNGGCNAWVASSDVYNQDTKCVSGKLFSILCHLPGQDSYVVALHM